MNNVNAQKDIDPNTLIVELSSTYSSINLNTSSKLQSIFTKNNVQHWDKLESNFNWYPNTYYVKCENCNLESLKKELLQSGMFASVKNQYLEVLGSIPNDYNTSPANNDFQSDANLAFGDPLLATENSQYLNNMNTQQAYDIVSNYFDLNTHIDSRIGIIDNLAEINGIYSHEDLEIANYTDYSSNDATTIFSSNHGTMVAGLASGRTNNGVGLSSIGYNCDIYAYNAVGGCVLTIGQNNFGSCGVPGGSITAAFSDAIVDNVDVINCSIFMSAAGFNNEITSAINDSISVVIIAGNGNNVITGQQNVNCGNGAGNVCSACEIPGVICVSTVDTENKHQNTAGREGQFVDICASGGTNYWTLRPDFVFDANSNPIDLLPNRGGIYRIKPGSTTSASAPVVAGTVALMKAVNPCLGPFVLEELLKQSAQPIVDEAALIAAGTINAGDLGAGCVNAHAAVLAAENFNSRTIDGGGVTIIDTDENYNNLIVKSGSILKIENATVSIGTRIIVERGAKLIAENCTLTACNRRWYGIEAWGNNAMQQNLAVINDENLVHTQDGPGAVILRNTLIEESRSSAITTRRRGSNVHTGDHGSPFRGALIYAENTTFRNNRRGVEFLSYPGFTNESRFLNCTFEVTVDHDGRELNHYGISMFENKGIEIVGCQFNHPFVEPAGSTYNTRAIVVSDSYIEVNGCTFTGWEDEAILITNATFITSPTVIGSTTANTFTDNRIGIYALSPHNIEIKQNNFIQTDNEYRVGIRIEGESDFIIEDNNFYDLAYGTLAYSTTGSLGELTDNYFRRCGMSVGSYYQNDALQMRCNNFSECNYDIVLGIQNSSIGSSQGSYKDPAGNDFSNPCQSSINNIYTWSGADHFNYFYNTIDLSENPYCDDGANYSKYPSSYNPIECPNLIIINPCKKFCLIEAWNRLNNLKAPLDKGANPQIETTLRIATNEDKTYRIIDEAGAFLSKSNLLAIAKSQELASWKKEEILIKNAPLSDEIMKDIE